MQLRMGGSAGTDIAQRQDDSTQQEKHKEGSKQQGKRASKRKLQATVRDLLKVFRACNPEGNMYIISRISSV